MAQKNETGLSEMCLHLHLAFISASVVIIFSKKVKITAALRTN
jgi:hypothetical protein